MAEPVGDLVVDLSLDAARFDEQMARVRRHFSGTETDAKKTAAVVEQSLSRQALAAQKAGISVGQYKAAMRMLPAQFTDVATQLAGGQSPWLILLQQGGQVKDSFGGMIPMFRGLAGAITLPMVGATSLAVATGALAYAWYQGNSTLSDFNKTLVLSGNQAGLTADRMLVLSRAGQAAGLTFNQTSESLTALVNAGVRGGEQFEAISQSVARFSSASGVEVDKVAEAFGKLTTDPTSGLTAMARQFHNVTAEQIAYVAQLQRSGDEAGALQAANEAATKGFDDQTRRLKENMGTLETWADRTARAFKSMWDSVLDIGRPDTAQGMLEKAEKAFDEADKKWQWYQSRSHRRGKTSAFLANLRGAWEDRANAQLGLSAATLQADLEKAREMAAKDWAESEASRLKYTEEAQKAYERLQTPLEKYTARQEELNKALKDGKILQADYNTLMAAAKKDYEATLKKPKQSGVKVSAGDRQEDSAHAALLTLQAELRTLEKHAGANEKISQQRRDLWKAESQFAVLEEAAQRRQLSAQEKSLLAHKDETLEYKRQLAALGDKVTYQERLNALAQQADIGAGIENTPDGMQSQVLLAADRIAMINPANGNTKPMFVGQGDQIFMNEVFLKRLTAPTITSGGNPPAFSLTSDGRLTAKNADISGSVNANSGTLNNVTINQNCTIKGMLEATQVRGDFVKAVSKAFPKKVGTWGNTETPNGTVTVTISDDHNFDRQIIIPPIIFNGIAYDDPGSGNNPGGTRYTGYGFEVRKNGVLIASRETKGAIPGSYSAVIDMPSGRGSVTLEFKIFQKGNQGAGNITDCTVIVTKKAASGISIR